METTTTLAPSTEIVEECLTPNLDTHSTQDVSCRIQDSQDQQAPITSLSASETTATTTLGQTVMDFKTTNQNNSEQDQDINIIQEIINSHHTPPDPINPPPIIQTVTIAPTATTTTRTRAARTTLRREEILLITKSMPQEKIKDEHQSIKLITCMKNHKID